MPVGCTVTGVEPLTKPPGAAAASVCARRSPNATVPQVDVPATAPGQLRPEACVSVLVSVGVPVHDVSTAPVSARTAETVTRLVAPLTGVADVVGTRRTSYVVTGTRFVEGPYPGAPRKAAVTSPDDAGSWPV